MRVLFSPHRDRQHLYPMVPLAWACRSAGHEVRIASAPVLVEHILATGLPAVAVGGDTPPAYQSDAASMRSAYQHRRLPKNWPLHPELLDGEQRATIEMLRRNVATAASLVVDDLILFARHWRPDLVVYDTAATGVRRAVRAPRLPRADRPHHVDRSLPTRHAPAVGWPVARHALRAPQRAGRGAVLADRAGRRTTSLPHLGHQPLAAGQAVGGGGAGTVQVGDGTTSTAAAFGVPQLVITRTPGTVLCGERLAAVGAGINLRYQELAADPAPVQAVRSAAEKLLVDPAYAGAALKLQDLIEQQPAPAMLVPVLEALTAQR